MADEVWFLPNGRPWQKEDTSITPAVERKRMVELAIEGVHSWKLNSFELDREQENSYTVNTLEYLSERYPDYSYVFVIGADQMINLTSWKHWRSLFDFARIGVVDRIQMTEFTVPTELKRFLIQNSLFRIPMPQINISSTFIRRNFELLSSGNPEVEETARIALESALPASVHKYLMTNPIYSRKSS